MPYIDPLLRFGGALGNVHPTTVGELTYRLTKQLTNYVDRMGESFDVYAECLGALEAVKLELYRRRIAPYEDKKCAQNGDVF
jgi:hypothetical protein